MNQVVNQAAGTVALPQDLMAELAGAAKDAAAEERPSVSKLSTAGGQLKYQSNPVPGNNLDVVIMAAPYRNVYYEGRYDPDNIKNPACFALSDTDEDMKPHPNAAQPQAKDCASCPKGQWKSADTGKGKACKQSRRMVLIPATALESAELVGKAEMALLDLPVTSVKNYPNFVNALAASTNLPPWAAVANVKVQPSKNMFEVVITPIRQAGDEHIIRALRARTTNALELGLLPYDETSESNSGVSEEQKARQAKVNKKLG
jgi:hypothetical protein